MKERSILISSTGSRLSCAREEYPVPKSSIEIRMWSSRSAFNTARARSGSDMIAVSVTSTTRLSLGML